MYINTSFLALLLHAVLAMLGSKNTYTCTCAHFCKGYKTGLSRATYYRHAPYRDSPQSSTFSASFQTFLDNSAHVSGGGRDTSHASEDSEEDRGSQAVGTSEMEYFENPQVGLLLQLSSYKCISHIFSFPVMAPKAQKI
jgi:hypothetical protein